MLRHTDFKARNSHFDLSVIILQTFTHFNAIQHQTRYINSLIGTSTSTLQKQNPRTQKYEQLIETEEKCSMLFTQ